MAEFAEQSLQEMIPEFEELERLGLLSSKEVKKLIVKRRNFEYKMCKSKKEMQDFFAYCLYDTHLLDLLSIRRQRVMLMKRYHQIEISIIQRVLKRLRMMTHLWHDHPTVWKFRLSFAYSRNFLEEVSTIYAEQVKFLGADENIWVSWAQWEVERRNNFDKARNILLSRAPLYHPKSILITKEYFRLELLYLKHLKKRNIETGGGLDEIVAENREKVLQCAVPMVIFKNALKEFDSPDICLHFYWIAHEFTFANHLRDIIFSKMVEMFPNSIQLYKLKAKMILDGYIVDETKIEENEESIVNDNEKEEEKDEESENEEEGTDFILDETDNEENVSDKDEEEEDVKDEESENEEEETGNIVNETKEEESKESIVSDKEEDEEKDEDSENKEDTADCDRKDKEKKSTDETKKPTLIKVSFSPKEKLDALFALYDTALSCNKVSDVLSFIVEDSFNILNQVWGSKEFRNLVAKKLMEIFKSHSSALTPTQFLIWFALTSEENCSEVKMKKILKLGRKYYPNCQNIELAWLPFMKAMNVKNKLKLIERLSGNVGAEICIVLINNTEVNLRSALIKRACMHPDASLSKTIRVKILDSITDIKESLNHYEKYASIPPFCTKLHTSMIKKELKESSVSEEKVRNIFKTAVEQFGSNQYGLWLSYMEFERKFGQLKNVSLLHTEAEKQLKSKYLSSFVDCKFHLQSLVNRKTTKDGESVTVDCPEMTVENSDFEFWSKSPLPNLFENELTITHKEEQNRLTFFGSLAQIDRKMKESSKRKMREDVNENETWEELLSLILGQNICLKSKKVNLSDIGLDKDISSFMSSVDKIDISDENVSKSRLPKSVLSDETKKILESSEILKPEFLEKKQLAPFYLNKNVVKRLNKRERAKDMGKGWANMKAPEITEEVERDLQILKMRAVLNPRTHYKRNDMKTIPKHFHLGKVVDSPVDFYSSRTTKKERKQTLAEEIMKDESVLRYQKRKCTEIINMQNSKRFKRKSKTDDSKQVKKAKTAEKKKRKVKLNEEKHMKRNEKQYLKSKLMEYL